jgi:hypothetical protein
VLEEREVAVAAGQLEVEQAVDLVAHRRRHGAVVRAASMARGAARTRTITSSAAPGGFKIFAGKP